jgi:hypothetical protein
LTDPAALGDHVYNIHRDKEFLEYNGLYHRRLITPFARKGGRGRVVLFCFCRKPTAPYPQSISSVHVGASE